MRVQIPAYTDMWMRGARYGDVLRTFKRTYRAGRTIKAVTIALVKLDATNRNVRVNLDDCQIIDSDSAFEAYAESVGRRALFDPES